MATASIVPLVAQRRPLGSCFVLIFGRTFQLVWTLGVLLLVSDIFSPPADIYTKDIFVTMTILSFIRFHWYACGCADEGGLTVRRYVKQYFVPWNQVKKANWGGWDLARLVIETEYSIEGSRRLDFDYSHRVGPWHAFRRKWIPENVKWVLDRVKAHQPA